MSAVSWNVDWQSVMLTVAVTLGELSNVISHEHTRWPEVRRKSHPYAGLTSFLLPGERVVNEWWKVSNGFGIVLILFRGKIRLFCKIKWEDKWQQNDITDRIRFCTKFGAMQVLVKLTREDVYMQAFTGRCSPRIWKELRSKCFNYIRPTQSSIQASGVRTWHSWR